MSNQVPSTNSSQGSSRAPALLPNSTPSLNANTPLPATPGVQASAAASAASLPAMVSSVAAAISGSSPSVSVSISHPSVQPAVSSTPNAAPAAPISLDDQLRQLLSQSAERQRAAQAALRSSNSAPGSAPGIPSASPAASTSAPGSILPASASLYQQLLAIAEVSRPNRSAAAPSAPASGIGVGNWADLYDFARNPIDGISADEHPANATKYPGKATDWIDCGFIKYTCPDPSSDNHPYSNCVSHSVLVHRWERIKNGYREFYEEQNNTLHFTNRDPWTFTYTGFRRKFIDTSGSEGKKA